MADEKWDIFISYASEDRHEVAVPLASALRRAGARVWLDEQELVVGDSLTEKIDEGLSESRYGAVVLSPSFFAKHWPRRELAGLRAREESGRKTILPVWHKMTKADVTAHSPILADALAADTSNGVEKVAQEILGVLFVPTYEERRAENTPASRRLVEMLDSAPDRARLLDFMRFHLPLVPEWTSWAGDMTVEPTRFNDVEYDAYRFRVGHGVRLTLVKFTDSWNDPFQVGDDGAVLVRDEITRALSDARELRQKIRQDNAYELELVAWIDEKFVAWRSSLRSYEDFEMTCLREQVQKEFACYGELEFDVVIFGGRRSGIDRDAVRHDAWSRVRRDQERSIELRTYDYLIDTFLGHRSPYSMRGFAGTNDLGDRW